MERGGLRRREEREEKEKRKKEKNRMAEYSKSVRAWGVLILCCLSGRWREKEEAGARASSLTGGHS